ETGGQAGGGKKQPGNESGGAGHGGPSSIGPEGLRVEASTLLDPTDAEKVTGGFLRAAVRRHGLQSLAARQELRRAGHGVGGRSRPEGAALRLVAVAAQGLELAARP